MLRGLRPVVVFGFAGVAATAVLQLRGASGAVPAAPTAAEASLGGAHGLDDLEILETTLYHVEENYVEPGRIDHEAMYVAALEAVEAEVPVCRFRREADGAVVHVEIAEYRGVLQVPPIRGRRELQRRLEEIGRLLGLHLAPEDLPGDRPDPYARLEHTLVNGILSTLDPHSVLLSPEDAREMDIDNDGQYGGLGFTMEERDGRLLVGYVRPGDPADRAGLRTGDHVARIDGVSTINMPPREALERIRGPVGEPVTLEVRRPGEPPRVLRVERGLIRPDAVEEALLDGGILYVAIPTFHDDVEQELHAALHRASRSPGGVRGLVLDLRGNPGGYLTQAVGVANAFLDSGVIVSTVRGGGLPEPPQRARAPGTEPPYPIAVLVDADSASASEIVAGALRNNDRAVLVGERTFGKGSVQNLWDFEDGSKLKLTVSRYLTPGDVNIQSVGIPVDVAMRPVVVERDDEGPVVRLAWRERTRREADLDLHLDGASSHPDEAIYEIPYLRPREPVWGADGRPDPVRDPEIAFAAAVVRSAPAGRRGAILAEVGPLVERVRADHEREIGAAMASLGIDWSDGPGAGRADLEVVLEGDALVAGTPGDVVVTVTNRSDVPLYRLLAVTAADDAALDGREWIFGHLAPGASASWTHTVEIPVGHGGAVVPLSLAFRDAGGPVASRDLEIAVAGAPLPRLAWAWAPIDLGDGDGLPEAGEAWALDVTVHNLGEGPTRAPYVRLANRSGRAVDLHVGTVHPGDPLTPDGEACPVASPGWDGVRWVGEGPPVGDPGDVPVVWADGCRRVVPPGGAATVRLTFDLVAVPPEGVELALAVGDAVAYDHATVVREGFWSTFGNEVRIGLRPGEAAASGAVAPPLVEISRAPAPRVAGGTATVSGVVTDDTGIAHVVVFAGEDKVFFEAVPRGAGPVRTVPFTATVPVGPGRTAFTVIATDEEGLTHTASVATVGRPPSEVQAARGPSP